MNGTSTKYLLSIIITLLMGFILSCDRTPTPSVFVENQPADRPDPAITSMTPENEWLSGIGTITIHGSNFSTVPEENAVFFGGTPATILSTTATEIVVETPNVEGDSLEVKVSVLGALLFSNRVVYKLQSAIQDIGSYGAAGEKIFGIAVDKDENLYASIQARRIDRILADGTKEDNFIKSTGGVKADNMRFGPGNDLYTLSKRNTIYRNASGNTNGSTWLSGLPDKEFDLDFDQNGNIYTAGDGDSLTLVHPDKSFETVAGYVGAFIKAVRLYNGYVYVAGTAADGQQMVWRNQINAPNDLGVSEVVFNLTQALGEFSELFTMAFDENGDMYLGINGNDPILVVHPDGSNEPLYPGIWLPEGADRVDEAYDIVWGNDVFMYVVRRHVEKDAAGLETIVQNILKVNMLKNSAPYFGRN